MKSQSKWLRTESRKRQFLESLADSQSETPRRVRVLDRANPVLRVLNGESGTESQEKLAGIVQDMRTLFSMCAEVRRHRQRETARLGDHVATFDAYPTEEGFQARSSIEKRSLPILQRVNCQLSRSRWSQTLMVHNGTDLLRTWDFHAKPESELLEHSIWSLLEYFTPAEEVHRFRTCDECGTWLFAVTEHQKYCGEKCRLRHVTHGKQFKEKRRRYMKHYRNEEKQRELAAKRFASKSKGR